MSTLQHAGNDGRFARRYEYDDCVVIAVDMGVADDAVTVDVVGTTAIVVVETGESVSESELQLPGTDPTVTTNNGILTITVEK
jgi:HSP20 family molecular chaperone IbpA